MPVIRLISSPKTWDYVVFSSLCGCIFTTKQYGPDFLGVDGARELIDAIEYHLSGADPEMSSEYLEECLRRNVTDPVAMDRRRQQYEVNRRPK